MRKVKNEWNIVTNVPNKITCPIKKIENPASIAKSKVLIGEYNKTKGTINEQFIVHLGFTCSESTTERSKQVVTLTTVNNKGTTIENNYFRSTNLELVHNI